MSKNKNLADFHIHSICSFDGVLTPAEVVKYSRDAGTKWISITDHNNLEGVRSLWDKYNQDPRLPYINCDGVNVISGVEVTCRVGSVLNKKGNTCKVHLLVYGADLSSFSPLSRLMLMKHENDLAHDFGALEYLLSLKPNNVAIEK